MCAALATSSRKESNTSHHHHSLLVEGGLGVSRDGCCYCHCQLFLTNQLAMKMYVVLIHHHHCCLEERNLTIIISALSKYTVPYFNLSRKAERSGAAKLVKALVSISRYIHADLGTSSAFPSYISGVYHHSSSSSAFPSYISGVHHFGWDFDYVTIV